MKNVKFRGKKTNSAAQIPRKKPKFRGKLWALVMKLTDINKSKSTSVFISLLALHHALCNFWAGDFHRDSMLPCRGLLLLLF